MKSQGWRCVTFIVILLWACSSKGQSYFNPEFLSGSSKVSVADLSRFEKNQQIPGVYRGDVYKNGDFFGAEDLHFNVHDTAQGKSGGLMPCITEALLVRLGVNTDLIKKPNEEAGPICINLPSEMPASVVDFDFSAMRVDIRVPQFAMINSVRGYIPPDQWDEGVSSFLLNYGLSGNSGIDNESYYLNIQPGINYGAWRLRNNSTWRYSRNSTSGRGEWQSIGTWAQRTIAPMSSELIIGDGNTSNEVFDSLGFRGARIFSSDDMQPDSMRGYAPSVRGIARTPARVVIKQNGYVIYQSYVQAGEFLISDLNPTTSSGDLQVVIEESDGTPQRYTVPYSAVPVLQREGRLKYDLTAGNFRSGNDRQDDPLFIQATAMFGLTSHYTLYGGAQLAERYKSLNTGVGQNLGSWGAVSLDLTHARSQLADNSIHTGQSLRFLYAKSFIASGTHFQVLGYRYSTEGFYTLDDSAWEVMQGYQYEDIGYDGNSGVIKSYHNLDWSRKGQMQININQSLERYGSIFLSGNQQRYWRTDEKNAWYQFGYANDWRGVTYSLSWAWNKSPGIAETDQTALLSVSIPTSLLIQRGKEGRAHINSSVSHSKKSGDSARVGIGGTLLDDQSLSYNLSQSQARTDGSSSSASLNWNAAYGNFGVGYNKVHGRNDVNWQATGGVVAHPDGVTLSQPLGNTNVLVEARGASGVRVENQVGIKTNNQGYTVIPHATPYRYNRVALEANSLPLGVDIQGNVTNSVPTRGALVRARFDAKVGARVLATITIDGEPAPFAATVIEANTGSSGIIADNGVVYLSGVPLSGNLSVSWGEGVDATCSSHYKLPLDSVDREINFLRINCNENKK